MANPPPDPRAKIGRAKKHLADLDDERQSFLAMEPKPIGLVAETQADGRFVARLKMHEEIPDDIPLILGDLVHNLRSALDILICDLVRHRGSKVRSRAGFPIVDNPEKIKSAVRTKVRGAGCAVKRAVKRLDPYKGADNLFWVLHRLDIADKHSLLLTVAADDTGGIDPTDMMAAYMRDAMPTAGMTGEITFPRIRIGPKVIDCYKDGDIVVEYPADPPEHHEKIKYGFGIAIDQPGIVDCEPLIPFATELINFVERTVTSFDQYFA